MLKKELLPTFGSPTRPCNSTACVSDAGFYRSLARRTIDSELLARPRMTFFSAAAAFLGGILTALLMLSWVVELKQRTESESRSDPPVSMRCGERQSDKRSPQAPLHIYANIIPATWNALVRLCQRPRPCFTMFPHARSRPWSGAVPQASVCQELTTQQASPSCVIATLNRDRGSSCVLRLLLLLPPSPLLVQSILDLLKLFVLLDKFTDRLHHRLNLYTMLLRQIAQS